MAEPPSGSTNNCCNPDEDNLKKINRRYFLTGTLALAAAGLGASWPFYRSFGALPEKPPNSPHWHDGAFHNLPNSYVYKGLDNEPVYPANWLRFFFSHGDRRYPSSPVPSRDTNLKSLRGGFAIDAGSGGKIYFTGDGGFGNHFRDIGKSLGPFEIIFPDSGQYNRAWNHVHMFPEQSVQAAVETGSRLACPVHIGKFTLAWHPWNEPMQRFGKKAEELKMPFILPAIGEKRSI